MCCGPWGRRESHATWRLHNNRNRREPSLPDAQHPAQRERAVIYRWLPRSWSRSRHGNCGMWAAMPLPSIISNEHLHVEITHGIIKGYTDFQSHLWSSTPTPNSQQEVNVCAQFNSLKAYVFPEYWIQTQSRHWWAKDLLSPLFPLTFKIWLNCVLKILTDGAATLEKLGWFFQMLELPYDGAILLSGTDPRENEGTHPDKICTRLFTIALFWTTQQKQTQLKCPSADEWINITQWYIHTNGILFGH